MGASASDISTVRWWTAASESQYSNEYLASVIERYPLPDLKGEFPTLPDGSENTEWTPRYDLHAASADIWEEKAASLAGNYDFEADGASYKRSQAYQQALEAARYHRARRAVVTIAMKSYPPLEEDDDDE